MKTITELRDYLLKHYVDDDGDLDLVGLDFSDFNGNVHITDMKVKGSLHQGYQDVKGHLWQGGQNVKGHLWQSDSKIKGNYDCICIKVGGVVNTNEPIELFKKITREELAEMGYEVVDDE